MTTFFRLHGKLNWRLDLHNMLDIPLVEGGIETHTENKKNDKKKKKTTNYENNTKNKQAGKQK